MDRKTMDDLTVKRDDSDSKVVSVRVSARVVKLLQKKGIDINKTVRNLLERLAE